jgi:peroxiredoxin-like protein
MQVNNSMPPAAEIAHKMQFATRLDWLEKKEGIITANDVKDALRVATPKVFGGEGEEWSPEHLLISAVSSCFMTTYLFFAEKVQLEITYLNCLVTGQVSLENGKYELIGIDLYPKIYIRDETFRERAMRVLKRTEAHCLVSSALRTPVVYHSEVLQGAHPK